jgi:hypothetical protein
MLSNSARFVFVSAAASFIALSSAPAHACSDIADAASDLIAAGSTINGGAAFFSTSVKTAFGYTNTDLSNLWGSSSPASPIYYQKITTATYFTQIADIGSLAAGDAMVINSTADGYNGHTMIITGAATQLVPAINPIIANTNQWVVPIADSTTATHGCSPTYRDSRWSGSCGTGTFTAGPGTAFIRLYSDLSGGLLGYTWSVTSAGLSNYYSPSTRPYAIGRLTPCPPI